MTETPLSDESARALRGHWFVYLDTIESLRTPLHDYCLRLTRNTWDAEDLVQETLLRGFSMIARGDLHGSSATIRNARAYLFRAASNLWIDQQRRPAIVPEMAVAEAAHETPEPGVTRDALRRLASHTSPQERASIILKDVFDFSLDEIADQLRTTVTTVKSALHRARARLEPAAETPKLRSAPSPETIDRFVAAFNARDLVALTALLTEHLAVEVLGVGGSRGRSAFLDKLGAPTLRAERREYDGEAIVVVLVRQGDETMLRDVMRFTEADGQIARITAYLYAPDTLERVGKALGLSVQKRGYHQPADVVTTMVATTFIPWAER